MIESSPFEAVSKPAPRAATGPIGRRIVAGTRVPFGQMLQARVRAVNQYALFYGGIASFVFGCYMIYHPLGPIAGGIAALSLALLMSQDEDESNKQSSKGR